MTVSPNSARIYHEEIKGKKEISQGEVILKAVEKLQPCSAKQVQRACPQYEVNVISRALNTLRYKDKKIEEYFTAKCIITNRKVAHYRVVPIVGQTKIF